MAIPPTLPEACTKDYFWCIQSIVNTAPRTEVLLSREGPRKRVAMEPSGNRLRTEAEGRRKINEGHVNFATQLYDYMLVHVIWKYLLREGEGYCITDLGKCSTPVGAIHGTYGEETVSVKTVF